VWSNKELIIGLGLSTYIAISAFLIETWIEYQKDKKEPEIIVILGGILIGGFWPILGLYFYISGKWKA